MYIRYPVTNFWMTRTEVDVTVSTYRFRDYIISQIVDVIRDCLLLFFRPLLPPTTNVYIFTVFIKKKRFWITPKKYKVNK